MYQSSTNLRGQSPISVIGAGIAGAWQALLFARSGRSVTIPERSAAAMTQSTSHWAGGMLAPYCEAEGAEPAIVRLGLRSLKLWREYFPQTPFNGSLGVAHARDRPDFERFSPLPDGYLPVDAEDIKGTVIDCRGLAARKDQPELRGVKGELILIETDEVELRRPVRLIHPRFPLYAIPRGDNRFMLGATSIESESSGVSVRSALELLGAAYAVHPAFAEARILEFGSGLRPAFPDNLPRIAVDNERIAVNGLYRHGFLLAPALAELTLGYIERGRIDNEVMQCA